MATTEMPRKAQVMNSSPPSVLTPGATPPPRRQRKRGFLALAAALIVLFAVGNVAAFNYFSATRPAVGTAHAIGYGQQITAGDLVEVSVPNGGPLNSIDWAQRGSVIGQYAVTDLQPGQLLPAGSVAAALTPLPGTSVVGVAVKRGLLPAGELAAGSTVRVVAVQTAPGGSTAATAGITPPVTSTPSITAKVYSIAPADTGGTTVVDVVVADANADTVARLSAAGQAALVLQPRR